MTGLHDPDGILSTMPTYWVHLNGYGYSTFYDYLQGTSQAAPHVAGLAALIWSLQMSLTPDQVQAIIETTAQDRGPTGWDPDYGHGRIDALAALDALQPPVRDLDVTSAITGTGVLTATLGWTPPPTAVTVIAAQRRSARRGLVIHRHRALSGSRRLFRVALAKRRGDAVGCVKRGILAGTQDLPAPGVKGALGSRGN